MSIPPFTEINTISLQKSVDFQLCLMIKFYKKSTKVIYVSFFKNNLNWKKLKRLKYFPISWKLKQNDKSKNTDWIWGICTAKMFHQSFLFYPSQLGDGCKQSYSARSISENLIRQSLILNKSFDLFFLRWSVWGKIDQAKTGKSPKLQHWN